MASVNLSSIREGISHEKEQLDEQVRSSKVANETRMLFNTLLTIVIFLEKNSKNSSIPQSQTNKDESSAKAASKRKGPAQNHETFDNSRSEQ